MGLAITIHIQGTQTAINRLKALGDSLNNLEPAMKDIGKQFVGYYASIGILDRGRPWGTTWPDYSPAYKKWKERHYAGRPMMVVSGTLSDSFKYRADKNSVVITNSAPYFKYHQSNKPRKTKLPRREMMGINSPLRRVISQSIKDEINKKLQAVT